MFPSNQHTQNKTCCLGEDEWQNTSWQVAGLSILFALRSLYGSSSHEDIRISKTWVIPEKPKHNKIIIITIIYIYIAQFAWIYDHLQINKVSYKTISTY